MRNLPDWVFYVVIGTAAWVAGALFLGIIPGCASAGDFFSGIWGGAKEAAPKAIDELSTGQWQAAAITLGTGMLGGGLLWWARGKKRKKKNGPTP